ncbi:Ger(x)C family spore germination protein [Paenibacillus periandrae]|uniref:Ger(x)C family spore germination protein n=1 Tax=Paenibacillus periandrae TaxID=1761741 RepID=UPI001F09D559|nr:Ger(x)C family spore germination protein [Paenibacillus periandrae]
MKHRTWRLAVILGICLISSGCRGNMELNDLHLVHSIAIDEGSHGLTKLTAEIAELSPSGQQPKGMHNGTFFLSSEGNSLFEAARLMRTKSDRTLLWGHTAVILFSKAAAKNGINKHIEAIRRLKQFRNSTLLYVTEGQAFEALQVSKPKGPIFSQTLKGLSQGEKSTALTQQTSLIEVYKDLVNRTHDLTIPALQVVKDPIMSKKQELQATGLYAFQGEQLIGLMSTTETKGYLRALNKMESAVETLSCGPNQSITFENVSNKSVIQPFVDTTLKPKTHIDIYATLNITGYECKGAEINPEIILELEKKLNKTIASDVQQYIRYSQKHKIDLLGIGEKIHRSYPNYWKKMQASWDDIYATSQFTVTAHCRIDHTNFIFEIEPSVG